MWHYVLKYNWPHPQKAKKKLLSARYTFMVNITASHVQRTHVKLKGFLMWCGQSSSQCLKSEKAVASLPVIRTSFTHCLSMQLQCLQICISFARNLPRKKFQAPWDQTALSWGCLLSAKHPEGWTRLLCLYLAERAQQLWDGYPWNDDISGLQRITPDCGDPLTFSFRANGRGGVIYVYIYLIDWYSTGDKHSWFPDDEPYWLDPIMCSRAPPWGWRLCFLRRNLPTVVRCADLQCTHSCSPQDELL